MRVIGLNPITEGKSPAATGNPGMNTTQEPRPTSPINRQVNFYLRKISENLGRQLRNSYKTT